MPPTATVIVPTQRRAAYLDVALASIRPQAEAAQAEVLVVDDGPDDATRAAAERHGARYVAHDAPRGLNAARNTGIDHAHSDLYVFVDDDIAARPGWLAALVEAAATTGDDVGVLTGPVHARFEGHRYPMCGREGPPITFLDLGPHDTDADHAWGANMTVTRHALDRAGRFDEALELYGDEVEWQARVGRAGMRIRYVAAAAVDHRRAGDDARVRNLARAAYGRGRASRRQDVRRGPAPTIAAEARTLGALLVHGPRYRCANGIVLGAHSAGRLAEAVRGKVARPAPPPEDFLVGRSGETGGKGRAVRRAADRALDAAERVTGRRRRILRAAATGPRRRVLVVGVFSPGVEGTTPQVREELAHSRHEVDVVIEPAGPHGKFENANRLLARHPPAGYDWLLVVDDDVVLPEGFLDGFLLLAERFGLVLAQPAQSLASHAAWPTARRRPLSVVRETTFVEIGPVTAFGRTTFPYLLPFPDLRQAWGLDLAWAALARQHGWRIGVVDAFPLRHELRRIGITYGRGDALAEARAFLAGRPYLHRDEVRTLRGHVRW